MVEADSSTVVPPHFAGSATTIDAREIAESGARSVAELLASKPGVRVSTTSGNTAGFFAGSE